MQALWTTLSLQFHEVLDHILPPYPSLRSWCNWSLKMIRLLWRGASTTMLTAVPVRPITLIGLCCPMSPTGARSKYWSLLNKKQFFFYIFTTEINYICKMTFRTTMLTWFSTEHWRYCRHEVRWGAYHCPAEHQPGERRFTSMLESKLLLIIFLLFMDCIL